MHAKPNFLSRMKRLEDCVIVQYEHSRYKRIANTKRMKDRLKEEERLEELNQILIDQYNSE